MSLPIKNSFELYFEWISLKALIKSLWPLILEKFATLAHAKSVLDNDNVLITFPTQESGYVVAARGGQIVSGSISSDNITGLNTAVLAEMNTAGVFSGSAQVTLSGDVTGTGAATVISTVDGETF